MQNDPGLEAGSPVNNKSFDALIDLLGSDDVGEDPRFRTSNDPLNQRLRDPHGHLNLRRVHSFFSGDRQDDDWQTPGPFGEPLAGQGKIGAQNDGSDEGRVRHQTGSSATSLTCCAQFVQGMSPRTLSRTPEDLPSSGGGTPSGVSPGTSYISRSNASTPGEHTLDSEGEDISHDGSTNPRLYMSNETVCCSRILLKA